MHAIPATFETTSAAHLAPVDVANPGTIVAYWALRIAAAMCFIGHGAFGFITKADWLPYFAVVGIPESRAWMLMPLIGALDVTAGMAVLFAPRGLALAYMAVWAMWTALLRPLSGDSIFEALERAGNYGVPLALLALTALPRSWDSLLHRLDAPSTDRRSHDNTVRILTWTCALLLAGHGLLGAIGQKALLTSHYATIGLPSGATPIIGWFEVVLAAAIVVRPRVRLLLFVVAWKLATETLFVVSGAPVWEFVERFGSYGAPLALAALLWTLARKSMAQHGKFHE
jgi:hypothetical protein